MEPAKDSYGQNYPQQYPQQYPPQQFEGQGVPVGGQNMPVGQPMYGGPVQYPPSNQMPPNYQQQQNYGMPPPPFMGPGNVVIVNGNQFIKTKPTQRMPEVITCKRCGLQNMTRITYEPGNGTWIVAFGLFIFACWPCCLVPLCMQDCQDCKHFCSSCGEYLGKKKFLIDEDD